MLRCLMLALTLIMITVSAAALASDEQLKQVLQQTKVPIESSVSQESESSYQESYSKASSKAEINADRPPRFVMDEPLDNMPPPPTEPEKDALIPIDPSTEAQLYAIEPSDYEPTPPTEQQKLTAAEPYVKELFELTESAGKELRSLADQVIGEYLAVSPAERSGCIPVLIEKYTPIIMDFERRIDDEAQAILLKMSAALTAIGADDTLVNDAKAAYEHSKQQQTAHYTELFSAFAANNITE